MGFRGQILLILISITFTAYQTVFDHKPFFTLDFLIFTLIAWLVGGQYDLARYYAKKARKNLESYKQLIESFPEAVFIHSEKEIIYINNAALEIMGASDKKQIIGRPLFDFVHIEYINRMMERVKQAKKIKQPLNNTEIRVKRPDGTSFFFEVSSLAIVFDEKKAILSIGRDVTERKEQTDRLLQKSEKLALLGQMAAGIAHEIRNPLTSIKGFIQLFKADNLKEEYVDIVLSELERINSIVGEFLVLAKPSAAVFKEQDIRSLIKDVVTLINTQSILNNVQIFVEFDSGLPMVSCEEKQLKQVFLNLLKNSIEAMPNGGRIDVSVKQSDPGKISIKVKDQGVGIPKERIPSLGEPFYTTKEKGTGLGLMTCFKIIESHHGELRIDSQMNIGTTIEVILPTINQPYLKSSYSYN
ncbi:ATP-binding protein [Peribacillus kribbensis]|uniref:ATP-binding protein n=1 Tax=Peribacillus kribbensis TaxID=356658 RepID=UPI00054FBC63|nr:ATP-binding protein [Peribacillus kribbensis]